MSIEPTVVPISSVVSLAMLLPLATIPGSFFAISIKMNARRLSSPL